MDDEVDVIITPDDARYGDMYFGDILESDIDALHRGGDNYDWSANIDIGLMTALDDKTLAYYRNDRMNVNVDNALTLNHEEIHRPENCRGDAQRFLVYSHIFAHYEWDQHRVNNDDII